MAPPVLITVGGTVQVEPGGAPEQDKSTVTGAIESGSGFNCSLYFASWPAVTLIKVGAPAAGSTLNGGLLPLPRSKTLADALPEITRVAARKPTVEGLNAAVTVQLAFT
jgi:hypothetical protein